MPKVTVQVPSVGYKGPHDTDASVFRRAANNLDTGYDVGGSNTRAAIAILLRRTADALEAPRATTDEQIAGWREIAGWRQWADMRNSTPEILAEAHELVDALAAARARAEHLYRISAVQVERANTAIANATRARNKLDKLNACIAAVRELCIPVSAAIVRAFNDAHEQGYLDGYRALSATVLAALDEVADHA